MSTSGPTKQQLSEKNINVGGEITSHSSDTKASVILPQGCEISQMAPWAQKLLSTVPQNEIVYMDLTSGTSSGNTTQASDSATPNISTTPLVFSQSQTTTHQSDPVTLNNDTCTTISSITTSGTSITGTVVTIDRNGELVLNDVSYSNTHTPYT